MALAPPTPPSSVPDGDNDKAAAADAPAPVAQVASPRSIASAPSYLTTVTADELYDLGSFGFQLLIAQNDDDDDDDDDNQATGHFDFHATRKRFRDEGRHPLFQVDQSPMKRARTTPGRGFEYGNAQGRVQGYAGNASDAGDSQDRDFVDDDMAMAHGKARAAIRGFFAYDPEEHLRVVGPASMASAAAAAPAPPKKKQKYVKWDLPDDIKTLIQQFSANVTARLTPALRGALQAQHDQEQADKSKNDSVLEKEFFSKFDDDLVRIRIALNALVFPEGVSPTRATKSANRLIRVFFPDRKLTLRTKRVTGQYSKKCWEAHKRDLVAALKQAESSSASKLLVETVVAHVSDLTKVDDVAWAAALSRVLRLVNTKDVPPDQHWKENVAQTQLKRYAGSPLAWTSLGEGLVRVYIAYGSRGDTWNAADQKEVDALTKRRKRGKK